MAHPKSKISKQRRNKRRTHHSVEIPQFSTCKATGETHLYHRTYKDTDGNTYYRGKMLIKVEEAI
jgi:large subunit ribosomal protein L32